MLSFLGVPEDQAELPLFPVAYPFRGVFYPSYAAWMLLNLYGGLYRCLSGEVLSRTRMVPDQEQLLPMLELSAGNRMRLPQECRRMADRFGMFFAVRRKKNTVLVRICPLIPAMEPKKFYALRAPLAVLWELRMSAPSFWGVEAD